MKSSASLLKGGMEGCGSQPLTKRYRVDVDAAAEGEKGRGEGGGGVDF